jgi:hypothetical protein
MNEKHHTREIDFLRINVDDSCIYGTSCAWRVYVSVLGSRLTGVEDFNILRC